MAAGEQRDDSISLAEFLHPQHHTSVAIQAHRVIVSPTRGQFSAQRPRDRVSIGRGIRSRAAAVASDRAATPSPPSHAGRGRPAYPVKPRSAYERRIRLPSTGRHPVP